MTMQQLCLLTQVGKKVICKNYYSYVKAIVLRIFEEQISFIKDGTSTL